MPSHSVSSGLLLGLGSQLPGYRREMFLTSDVPSSIDVFPQRIHRRSDCSYCVSQLRPRAPEFFAPVRNVVNVVDVYPSAIPRADWIV